MSVLDFHNLLKFQSIWKSIPFHSSSDQQLVRHFSQQLLDSEKNASDIEKRKKQCYEVLQRFPKISSRSKDISQAYSLFMEERKVAWLYLSLALYHHKYDFILDNDSAKQLEKVATIQATKRVILAPFHMGMHTMSISLLLRFLNSITIMVNSDEIDIISEWTSTYLAPEIKNNIKMVPIPSPTSPLKFAKAIMRGSTGVIFPEFSYGINQDFVQLDFLGGVFHAPIGVYELGKRLSAVVIPIGSIWNNKTSTIEMKVGNPLDAKQLNQVDFLQSLFQQGEQWICTHPEQWFWEYVSEQSTNV